MFESVGGEREQLGSGRQIPIGRTRIGVLDMRVIWRLCRDPVVDCVGGG
jgi:hypothetical protein